MRHKRPGEVLGDMMATLIVIGLGIGTVAFFATMVRWLVWAVVG